MAEEDRQKKEELYNAVTDLVLEAAGSFPEAAIVAPEGFQSFVSGISQVWGRKGVPGILIHSGRQGLVIDLSVSMTYGTRIPETGKLLQQKIREALESSCTETVSTVNIDVVRITE